MTSMTLARRWQSAAPALLSVLRIVAALLFIQFGTMKLWGVPMAMPAGFSPVLFSEIWFAGVLEVVGGTLLLIGLFTRPVAFLLSGQMAVAYFQSHAPNGFWPLVNGGTDAVLYCFVWLYFSAAGGGPWSADAVMASARK